MFLFFIDPVTSINFAAITVEVYIKKFNLIDIYIHKAPKSDEIIMTFSELYSGHFVREQSAALRYGSKDLEYQIGMVRGLIGPFKLVFSHIVTIEGICLLN